MENREFVRKISHQIKDKDIRDLKNGIVSVLVVRNIPLSKLALQEQLNRIGKLKKQDVSNNFITTMAVKKEGQGLPWHTDRSYHLHPPQFVALYSLSLQKKGGETLYCDLQKAYQELPQEMIKKIEQMKLLHCNKYMRDSKIFKNQGRSYRILSAVHPLIKSDKTGKYLFFNQDYTDDFSLKKELCRHVYQPSYIYKHEWLPFDLIISNNLKTNHARNKITELGESPRVILRFHLNCD